MTGTLLWRSAAAVAMTLGLAAPACAAPDTPACKAAPPTVVAELPAYQSGRATPEVIRTWGHVYVADAMRLWEAGFRRYHPEARFEDKLVSSAAALGALFSGVSDIGFVAREPRPMELAGYTRVKGQRPLGFRVMTGAYANADKVVALGVFVHKDNPLWQISFSQLDAVFGSETLRAGRRIRTWGDLGLTGPWAARPIHPYAGTLDAAPGFQFSQLVMEGSQLWNGDLKLFQDIERPGALTVSANSQVVAALAKDPLGIGIAGAGDRNPAVKFLAVSADDAGPYVPPSVANVAAGKYPLTRYVWLFVDGKPGAPENPAAAEFIRYILSREGQTDVACEGEYLPLPGDVAAVERAKLGPGAAR